MEPRKLILGKAYSLDAIFSKVLKASITNNDDEGKLSSISNP